MMSIASSELVARHGVRAFFQLGHFAVEAHRAAAPCFCHFHRAGEQQLAAAGCTGAVFAVFQVACDAQRGVLRQKQRPQFRRHAGKAGQHRDVFRRLEIGEDVLFAGEVHDLSAHGNAAKMLVQAQRRGGGRCECVADAHAYAALGAGLRVDRRHGRFVLERDGLCGAGYFAAFARSAVGAYAVFAYRHDVHVRCSCGLLAVGRCAPFIRRRPACAYTGRPVVLWSRRRKPRSWWRRCGQGRRRAPSARCSRTAGAKPCCRTRPRAKAGTCFSA